MVEKVRTDITDSPISRFFDEEWDCFLRDISVSQFDDKTLLVCVLWTMDSIREDKDAFVKKWATKLYKAILDLFSSKGINCDKDSVVKVFHLVCAFTLFCFGLCLKESSIRQDLYSHMINNLGEDWAKVRIFLNRIGVNSNISELQSWLLSYIDGNHYYTYSDIIDWDYDTNKELQSIRAKPSSNITVNIEHLDNHPGGYVIDNSTNFIGKE